MQDKVPVPLLHEEKTDSLRGVCHTEDLGAGSSFPSATDRLRFITDLIMDVACLHDGFRLIFVFLPSQPSLDFSLAISKNSAILCFTFCTHLKCPFLWLAVGRSSAFYPTEMGISTFFSISR